MVAQPNFVGQLANSCMEHQIERRNGFPLYKVLSDFMSFENFQVLRGSQLHARLWRCTSTVCRLISCTPKFRCQGLATSLVCRCSWTLCVFFLLQNHIKHKSSIRERVYSAKRAQKREIYEISPKLKMQQWRQRCRSNRSCPATTWYCLQHCMRRRSSVGQCRPDRRPWSTAFRTDSKSARSIPRVWNIQALYNAH